MQLEVKREELQKHKIFVATPMYGGMNYGLYMKSCLDLQALFQHWGIESRYSFLFNESLITRARNYLCDEFLRAEGFTHLLFIDSDIHFNPQDVLALLALDKDIIGAPYPKKSIQWENVKQAVKVNIERRKQDPNIPEIEAGELAMLIGDFVMNPIMGTQQFNVMEPLEVLEVGTGFMMIKREVFDMFREAFPEKSYRPDHRGQKHFDGSRYIHAYFDCLIDSKDSYTGGGTDRYLSEDYAFCQMCRKIGVKIWLAPWCVTEHLGTFPFVGNLPAIARSTGRI